MATHGSKRSEMKDKVSKPLGRRASDQVDSGSESHPLLSSGTSQTSHTSFGTVPCMFPDSETSDFESAPRRELPPLRDRQSHFNNLRRPYASQVGGASPRKPGRGSWDDQMSTVTFNRFQNYSKLRTYSYDPARPRMGLDLEVPPSVFVPYIPGGPDQDGGKQNSIVTIFAIWNTIMGSSLLTMPWGVERAGLPTAVALMVLMGALCLYTTYRILQVQDRHGDPTDGEVADLSRMLLGRSAEMVAKFFSLVVLLGANIVYWILMSNFLYHSVDFLYDVVTGTPAGPYLPDGSLPPAVVCAREPGIPNATMPSLLANQSSMISLLANQSSITSLLANRAQDDAFHHAWDMHTTVPIFLILIIAPLVNFKSATFFTKFNSLGTLSVAYLLVFVCIKASRWGVNLDLTDVDSPSYASGFLPSFPALSGMLALSFFIHNIIITIMRNNRVQENNGRDLSVAYVLVTLTYIIIGTVFYVTFPLKKSCIEDNLLNNFENWDVLTVVARIFLFFQLVTVYPLIAYMLRVQVFKTLLQRVYPGFSHVLGLNVVIIIICVLFAIFMPHIGTIIRFTGALSGMVYVFTLPCLLHLASLRQRGKLTFASCLGHGLVALVGCGNLVAQFFVQDH